MKTFKQYVSEEKLKGGLADNKTVEDIAKHHNVSVANIEKELAMGIEVEKEHIKDDNQAVKEISLDHLWEIPDYYTRLKKMELDVDNEII